MTLNEFIGDLHCPQEVLLPALPEDQNCVSIPRLSQVSGLLILPAGAAGPDSWATLDDVEGVVDNTSTDNTKAKWLTGRGEIRDPELLTVTLGKRRRVIGRRKRVLEFETPVTSDLTYVFLQHLQRYYRYRDFTFWIATLGGRFLGGQKGITPDFISAFPRFRGGNRDTEAGIIQLEWIEDIDPNRIDLDPFSDSPAGGTTTNVMFYQQSFPASASATLTWTENGGDLPTTNTKAQILLFQEGRKLEEVVEYSINHASGPGESEFTVNALTHYSGANYEAIAIITT